MHKLFLKINFLVLGALFFFLGTSSVKAMDQTEGTERRSVCKRSLDRDGIACRIPIVVKIVEIISQLASGQTKSRNGQARKLFQGPEFVESLATAFYVDALLCALEQEEFEMTESGFKQIKVLQEIQIEILESVQDPLTLTLPLNNEGAQNYLDLFIQANTTARELVIEKNLSWPENLLGNFVTNSRCFYDLQERLSMVSQ